MSRWSTRRAQVEPIAALAAVFAVCVGVGIYASALDASLPTESEQNVASHTLARVHDATSTLGVVEPDELDAATELAIDGYELNATLTIEGDRWSVGPIPPEGADVARRQVSARAGPAEVRRGTLRVEAWSR